MIKRLNIHISGITQGVGFRPFVYRKAKFYNLKGFVINSSSGVQIEVEGEETSISNFSKEIKSNPPLRARIDYYNINFIPLKSENDFIIKYEEEEQEKEINISPDIALCDECTQELTNPNDRRFNFPFISCDNCGPRYSNMIKIPYERKNITMVDFPMCESCLAEYNNPENRRFHVESISCPICGPKLFLTDQNGTILDSGNKIIEKIVTLLSDNKIVAIKGLCGYHIACSALSDTACATLRTRKNRPTKPFAVMFKNIRQLTEYIELDQEKFFNSPLAPILLLPKKKNTNLSNLVAPNNRYLGVMIPYTPLHFLILDKLNIPLVMTSGNFTEEPIAYRDENAQKRLSAIVDYFFIHNRRIERRVDDSIGFAFNHEYINVRNGRGLFPKPFILSRLSLHPTCRTLKTTGLSSQKKNILLTQSLGSDYNKSVCGMGAELKGSITLLHGNKAILSHYIGDIKNQKSFQFYKETLDNLFDFYSFKIELFVCDLHPDYLSTKYCEKISQKLNVKMIKLQHHRAHIYSVLCENELLDKFIGFAFDGLGMGEDRNIWGGEIFAGDRDKFERIGHFDYFPLPGATAAVSEPWRIVCGILKNNSIELKKILTTSHHEIEPAKIENVIKIASNPFFSPLTSSVGRLFDATASLLGFTGKTSFEAEAAIYLESIVDKDVMDFYKIDVIHRGKQIIMPSYELIKCVVRSVEDGIPQSTIAATFLNTISHFILEVSRYGKENMGVNNIILTGGVFQNQLLLKKTFNILKESGFNVYYNKVVPTNDAGISFGQAYFGALQTNA